MKTTFPVVSRLRGSLKRLLVVAVLIPLGACASFDGHPAAVLTSAEVGANNIDIRQALAAFYARDDSARGGLTREAYRNMVIGTFLVDADVKYAEFRRNLSRESKGSAFGLDLAILGLSGGASLANEKTANALAAGAAALTGTRATLSKDVYFDKTLPALLAGMDAQRTRIRTTMMLKLRQSADDYPLPLALADLSTYESAASLDTAIQAITADANARSEDAQQTYEQEVLNFTGAPEAGVAALRGPIRNRLLDLQRANNVAALQRVATAVGAQVDPGASAADIRKAIEDKIGDADTLAETQSLQAKVDAAIQGGP